MNEMNEKQIRLRSREEVQDFVQAASNCNFDIDISYDRVIIDAKSFFRCTGIKGYQSLDCNLLWKRHGL